MEVLVIFKGGTCVFIYTKPLSIMWLILYIPRR